MIYRLVAVAIAVILTSVTASAAILNEAEYGEFGDAYHSPTNFTGYNVITGSANGQEDFKYFWFDSLLPGTTSLDFLLKNNGLGSNMLIRLSATPFTMPEWDWKIEELGAGELYANAWAPEARYSFHVPDGFDGPLFGFARFYSTNSASSFSINAIGARADTARSPIPLPGTLPLLLVALGAAVVARRKSA